MEEQQLTKKCPQCQTDIPLKAKRCPNCQADIRNWFLRHKIITTVVVVFVALLVIGLVAGEPEEDGDGAEEQAAQTGEVLKVGAAEFIGEFDANQLAAEEKYQDKLVEFTAYIANISADVSGIPFLLLQPISGTYSGTGIRCSFSDKATLTPLRNGQRITLRGLVSWETMEVIDIRDCVIVE